jgi:hypothetical protein
METSFNVCASVSLPQSYWSFKLIEGKTLRTLPDTLYYHSITILIIIQQVYQKHYNWDSPGTRIPPLNHPKYIPIWKDNVNRECFLLRDTLEWQSYSASSGFPMSHAYQVKFWNVSYFIFQRRKDGFVSCLFCFSKSSFDKPVIHLILYTFVECLLC